MDIDEDITQLRLKLSNDKYDSMLKNVSDDDLKKYIKELRDKESNTIKQTTNTEVIQPVKELFNGISDMYKRPWNKLPNIHRSQKIEEYLQSITEIDNAQREQLMNKLTKLLTNKTITKKNEVNYDEKNGCILSIKRLIFDKNKNKYELSC
jgi:hypothetical protein